MRRLAQQGEPSLSLAVVCTLFPSRVQPWLLNSIEQAMIRGASPVIYAFRTRDKHPPQKASELGLLEATVYVRPRSLLGVGRTLALAMGKGGETTEDARRGLRRLLAEARRFGASPGRALAALAHAPAIGRRSMDIVHCHSMIPAWYFLPVLQIRKCPMVYTFHGLPPEGVGVLAKPRRIDVFNAAARVLVNTRFAARQVQELGCPADRIQILPQGIVLQEFPFNPRVPAAGEPVRMLTVGRLQPDKGHSYALEAIAELVRRGARVQYRIVGAGELRTSLEAMAAALGIMDNVHFLGSVPEEALADEYRNAQIFILPSLRDRVGRHEETQGVVLQEAQASGCLIVSTRTGGIPECVDDGHSAFLVPDRDARALADALGALLRRREEWPGLLASGRRWVEKRFDSRLIGDQLWSIYEGVIAEARSTGG